MKATYTIALLLLSSTLFSQSTFLEGRGATGQGLWAENVSGVSSLSQLALGVSLENHFGLSELNYAKLRIGIPNKYGVFIAQWANQGDELYGKNEYGLSFARLLSPTFAMGMTGRLHEENSLGEKQSDLLMDVGIRYKINSTLSAASLFSNPFRNAVEPSTFHLGLEYSVTQKVFIILRLEKRDALPIDLNVQLNYFPTENIVLQSIVSTESSHNSFGIAFLWKSFSIDAFLSYHSYLGFSPQIALTYSIQ